MEKKVLTQEEVDAIKDLQDKFQIITVDLGQLESQIININVKKRKVTEQLEQLMTQEDALTAKIQSKYGKGTILLDSGEFIPS